MAKLPRVTNKLFAENAATDDIGQFGSAIAGTKLNTTDIETIQALPAWQEGWKSAVVGENRYPAIQERNGVDKVFSYQIDYMLQQGIPEYDAGTTYYKGSVIKSLDTNSKPVLYTSLVDNNMGKPLSDTNFWSMWTATGVPVGAIFPCVCSANWTPENALHVDGAEYASTQFPTLWTDFLTATTPKLATCTYEQYASDIATYGQCAKFAVDTENNKFKVPTIKDGACITQAKSDAEIGKAYNESLPNIEGSTGLVPNIGNYNGSLASGAFTVTPYTLDNSGVNSGIGYKGNVLGFNASGSSSVYQDNAKVQGDNVRLRWFVVVATGTTSQSAMDWSEWATSLTGKANKNLENIEATREVRNNFISWGMPDYSAGVSFSSVPYTADRNYLVVARTYLGASMENRCFVDGELVFGSYHSSQYQEPTIGTFILPKSSVLTTTGVITDLKRYPFKGDVVNA